MEALKNQCKKLGYTYSEHQAMTGSKYYKINDVKFRISDHSQPSHYQARQYFNVFTENDIIDIISNSLFGKVFNPAEINGVFYNMIYVEERDGFDRVKLSRKQFDETVKLKEKQKYFYYKKGWEGEIY